MKKFFKVLAATAAILGVTGVGVAQAAPSSHSESNHTSRTVTVRVVDTGW